MKFNRITGITLTLLIISMLTMAFEIQPVKAEPLPHIHVEPPEYNAELDEMFIIAINVSNVVYPYGDLYGYDLSVGYNSTILEVTSVTVVGPGQVVPSNPSQYSFFDSSVSGIVRVAVGFIEAQGAPSFNGNGTLLWITFNGKAAGVSPIDIIEAETTLVNNFAMELPMYPPVDGSVTVGPLPPLEYTLTIYSSPTGVTFTVDGVSRITPWSGTYSEDASVSLVMPDTHTVGDAKYYWNQWSDGVTSRSRTVNMSTNITLTAYYTGPYYQLAVTSSPITGIAFTIDGVSRTTSYTEWLPEGSHILTMPEAHDGYVWAHWLEDGDINRTKTVTLNTSITLTGVFTTPSMPYIYVDPPTSTISTIGETLTIAINVYNVIDLYGYDVWVGYDNATLQVTSVTVVGPGQVCPPQVGNYTFSDSSVSGIVRVAVGFIEAQGAPSFNGNGTLLWITFNGKAAGVSPIDIIEAETTLVNSLAMELPMYPPVDGSITVMGVPAFPFTAVYLDPPTITGITIGEEFTVSIKIFNASNIHSWQAGLIFNATLLNCTGFFEGNFLLDQGATYWMPGTINNTAGIIQTHGCGFLGNNKASGDGILGYLTFKVKAPGVSDLHLRDVVVIDYYSVGPGKIPEMVPFNIIDVYTVVVEETVHKVVTVSNSTGIATEYYLDPVTGDWVWITIHSGFYDHAFNITFKEISFKVTGPYPGFSNVTIPKTLLNVSTLDEWAVIIDCLPVSRTITYNGSHYSIYFTYTPGIHKVQITTRPIVSSTISVAPSSTTITLGSTVTIRGDIDPLRLGATVTIEYRSSGGTWTTLANVTTDSNSYYLYTWMPTTAGTYDVKASWEGDDNTFGDVSDVQTLTVLPIHVFEVLWDDRVFHVVVESNSTLSDFYFSQPMKQIGFNVTGLFGTGFCKVTIPEELLWGDFIVYKDGLPLERDVDYTQTYNGTHYTFYITYTHTTHTIEVRGTEVIPEFPSAIILALFMFFALVAVALTKKITIRRNGKKTRTPP